MQTYIRHSRFFLIFSLVAALGIGIAILVWDKLDLHLWLNGTHQYVFDCFFKYYTYVGEWVPYVVVGLLLFYKFGWASFLLVDIALSGLIGQMIKYAVNSDRPYFYVSMYAPDIHLQFVDGVELSQWYSFPSGHTITFFALFMTLAVIINDALTQRSANKKINLWSFISSLLCFALALLGGYSRIYLNQHFAEDILGGILIGTITTFGLLFAAKRFSKSHFWDLNIFYLLKK